ncbi:MAG TPA: ATP-dependent DNA helicase RecQ [Myxococcales bacterium]|nr:ATP-dependent DNA helicase RecQ [Myxococcales bacterium]
MELSAALKEHFGYDAFRKGQEAVVRSVLSGRPTIAILPTGGGKSLCYQLPALLLEGTTVVVSPLVALMKDQVDALRARGIAATFVNSSLPESERQERQAALRRGEYRLVYVAPERFKSPSFLSAVAGLKVPLLAVDEAHCISAWGHDFRPEYQQLARAREQLKAERVLALTATATPEVRRDIADALELRDPKVFVAGFDRPNLFIEVLRVAGDKDKLGRLLALCRGGGPGIIYAATRKNVEKVVGVLRAAGIDALGYHAGMRDEERTAAQERFVHGDTKVIAATNAFGMGVDKADIRFVVHFDVPRSLEAYYQEIGRAGRDGLESHALLLFNFADVMMQRRMIEAGRPSRDLVERAWTAARGLLEGSIEELARECKVSAAELSGAVRLLESAGHLERGLGRDGRFFVATPTVGAEDLGVDFELLELRVARERQMLDRLVRFADTRGCRRQNLLRYFGDVEAPRGCDACESCKGSKAPEAEPIATVPRARKTAAVTAAAAPVEEGPYDAQVLEKLRALRTELARETRMPPYVVFHDATLRELARALPSDEKSFLAVKGAGPGRWQRYGERVLAITRVATLVDTTPAVHEAEEQQPLRFAQPRRAAGGGSAVEPAAAPAARASNSELWGLCAAGATLGEICTQLRRSTADVANELANGALDGRPLDVGRLLGAERVEAIVAAARGANGDVVAVRRRLAFPAALAEIRLAIMAGTTTAARGARRGV